MTDATAALLEEAALLAKRLELELEPELTWQKVHFNDVANTVRLLRALVGVLQQQETTGDKDLDTRVDESSSTNSPAVTTAGKDTVVPPTVSDAQVSIKPLRDRLTDIVNAAFDALVSNLKSLPNRYGDQNTIQRDIAVGKAENRRIELVHLVDVAVLNWARPSLEQQIADEFNRGERARCSMCEFPFRKEWRGSYGSYCPRCNAELSMAAVNSLQKQLSALAQTAQKDETT